MARRGIERGAASGGRPWTANRSGRAEKSSEKVFLRGRALSEARGRTQILTASRAVPRASRYGSSVEVRLSSTSRLSLRVRYIKSTGLGF